MTNNLTPLNPIFELMEQEIASYEALLGVLIQEWEYLKRNDTSSMLSLLKAKEAHINQIKAIQGSINQTLKETFGDAGCKDISTSLTQFVEQEAASQVKKMRGYQNTLLALKRQIQQVNERNKYFIEETLRFLQDLLSLLIYPMQKEVIYAESGVKEPAYVPSSWISKEI